MCTFRFILCFDSEASRPPEPAQRPAPYLPLRTPVMNKHGRMGGGITQNENNQVEFGRGGCKTHSRGGGLLRKSVDKRFQDGRRGLQEWRPGVGGTRRRCRKTLLQPGSPGLLTGSGSRAPRGVCLLSVGARVLPSLSPPL